MLPSKDIFGTASFWLSALGVSARLVGRKRTAGAALLLVGFGYLGVLHERLSNCRLANYRHLRRGVVHPREIAWHLPQLLYGYHLLTKERT